MKTRRGARPPLEVLFLLDVEDVFSPPELGNDDSPKEIADILTEEGVRGTFLFIGDCALLLKERKRDDVIEAMKRHEVGLHSLTALHPCGPELVAGKSWEEGLEATMQYSREGVEIIQDVFGQPCCALSQHAAYRWPHEHRAAALLGLPHIYGLPAAPPLYGPSWYAGALSFPEHGAALDPKHVSRTYFGGFENCYPNDRLFASIMRDFDRHIDACIAEGLPVTICHPYNPERLRLREVVDRFMTPNGTNYPEERWGLQGRPEPYTPAEVANCLKNFRKLVRRLRDDPRVRILTVAEAVERYGKQPATITRAELLRGARDILASKAIVLHERFSPAEMLLALAEAVLRCEREKKSPADLPRREALGPISVPPYNPEVFRCDWATLLRHARELLDHVKRTGHLPAFLGRRWARVGPNHLYRALAEAAVALARGRRPEAVPLERMPKFPDIAGPLGRAYVENMDHHLHDPDLDVNAVYQHGRLQTWTLKAAQSPG